MRLILILTLFSFASDLVIAEPVKATFEGAAPEVRWTLKELNPDLPSDWSGYEFLTVELRSSTAQRFEFRIFTTNGLRHVRLQPFQGAWIRAALPLAYFRRPDRQGFDLASLGNKSRVSYWINLLGSYGPLDAVEAIGLAMSDPIGSPVIEIRSVHLDKESPGDAVLESKPLVDEFGQWAGQDWPGKARTLDDLKSAWSAEEKELHSGDFDADQYGGFKSTQAKATGFFRVEQIDGHWWFVDPDGHLFFSTGADGMGPWMGTRTEGRGGVFAALPPSDLRPPTNRTNQMGMASFYTWNLQRRFGTNWAEPWVDLTLRRMDAWGLNTIANWSDPRLAAARRKPYVATLRGWGMETGYLGLPDVFAPDFAEKVNAAAARQCAPHKDDPWLIGYFIGNEPPWPGRETEIVSAILEGPSNAIQSEAKSFLAAGDTPERRREFVNRAIGKFLDTVNGAIHEQDPNHLNLGIRFGSRPTEAMLRASHGFDVFSMNSYGYEVNARNLEAAVGITHKPVLIGEFHFGTPGRGLAAGLLQTKNQEERGVAYRYYVENAAANPALIGVHWFEWIDEPNTGRMDGENYNIGMVDVTDRPYGELVEAMKATHRRLLAVHSGKEPPMSRRALVK
ncbi:MAG: hypothetical protein ABSG59_05975 [Verrucomicrobiota bacterium]|jgi:hypothetical protein